MSQDALRQLEELSNNSDILSVSSLQQNVAYPVRGVRSIATKYGPRTVVKIDDETEVFLPARFGKATPELIQQLDTTKFFLTYQGEEQLKCGFKKYLVKFSPK